MAAAPEDGAISPPVVRVPALAENRQDLAVQTVPSPAAAAAMISLNALMQTAMRAPPVVIVTTSRNVLTESVRRDPPVLTAKIVRNAPMATGMTNPSVPMASVRKDRPRAPMTVTAPVVRVKMANANPMPAATIAAAQAVTRAHRAVISVMRATPRAPGKPAQSANILNASRSKAVSRMKVPPPRANAKPVWALKN